MSITNVNAIILGIIDNKLLLLTKCVCPVPKPSLHFNANMYSLILIRYMIKFRNSSHTSVVLTKHYLEYIKRLEPQLNALKGVYS